MENLKKEGALIQLHLFNKLFSVFNTKEINLFIKKLNNSELKDDLLVKKMVDQLNSLKILYMGSNKLPKWAPVNESIILTFIDYMTNFLSGITSFANETKGKEK